MKPNPVLEQRHGTGSVRKSSKIDQRHPLSLLKLTTMAVKKPKLVNSERENRTGNNGGPKMPMHWKKGSRRHGGDRNGGCRSAIPRRKCDTPDEDERGPGAEALVIDGGTKV